MHNMYVQRHKLQMLIVSLRVIADLFIFDQSVDIISLAIAGSGEGCSCVGPATSEYVGSTSGL